MQGHPLCDLRHTPVTWANTPPDSELRQPPRSPQPGEGWAQMAEIREGRGYMGGRGVINNPGVKWSELPDSSQNRTRGLVCPLTAHTRAKRARARARGRTLAVRIRAPFPRPGAARRMRAQDANTGCPLLALRGTYTRQDGARVSRQGSDHPTPLRPSQGRGVLERQDSRLELERARSSAAGHEKSPRPGRVRGSPSSVARAPSAHPPGVARAPPRARRDRARGPTRPRGPERTRRVESRRVTRERGTRPRDPARSGTACPCA